MSGQQVGRPATVAEKAREVRDLTRDDEVATHLASEPLLCPRFALRAMRDPAPEAR